MMPLEEVPRPAPLMSGRLGRASWLKTSRDQGASGLSSVSASLWADPNEARGSVTR